MVAIPAFAAIGAFLTSAAPTLSLIASGVSAGASILGGIQTRSAAKATARSLDEAAQEEALSGQMTQQYSDRDFAGRIGELRSGFGASGLKAGSGSFAARLLGEERVQGEERFNIRRNSNIAVRRFQTEASMARFQGKQAMQDGLLSGFGTAVGGLSQSFLSEARATNKVPIPRPRPSRRPA